MQPCQRREGFLDNPVQTRIRQLAPDVGDDRHVMDDIAQRGRLDEQHTADDTRFRQSERFPLDFDNHIGQFGAERPVMARFKLPL
jgi:hypothetical protein